jgi:hypothetical protein
MTSLDPYPRPADQLLPGFMLGSWVTNGLDADGTLWVLEGCDGWDDSPDTRINFPDRVGADGAVDQPGYYSARVVVLSGAAVALDRTRCQRAKDTLHQVARSLRSTATLIGTDVAGQRQAVVKRSDAVKITALGATSFRYQLTLTAPDPLLYAALEQSASASLINTSGVTGGDWKFPMSFPYGFAGTGVTAGQMTAQNNGSSPTYPRFRVTGPGTGLTLASRGRALVITTLAAGQYLDLDAAQHSALLMGTQPRRDLLTPTSQWFTLQPGSNSVSFYAAAYSTATVTMTWRSAWL